VGARAVESGARKSSLDNVAVSRDRSESRAIRSASDRRKPTLGQSWKRAFARPDGECRRRRRRFRLERVERSELIRAYPSGGEGIATTNLDSITSPDESTAMVPWGCERHGMSNLERVFGRSTFLAILVLTAACAHDSGGRSASILAPLAIESIEDSEHGWTTRCRFEDGTTVELSGAWSGAHALAGEYALAYRESRSGRLVVLEPGHSRASVKFPARSKPILGAVVPRPGSRKVDVWTSRYAALCEFDLETGEVKCLVDLPTHMMRLDLFHNDPSPIRNGPGVAFDSATDRLFFALDEESNGEVASWQRSHDRRGGAFLASVDLSTHAYTNEFGPRRIENGASAWTISLARREFFVTSWIDFGYFVSAWSFDGRKLREYDVGTNCPGALALSPDERTLVVERRVQPEAEWEFATARNLSRAPRAGGFNLVDLESLEVRRGPDRGENAVWAPDGQSVYFVREFEVRRFRCEDGSIERVASFAAKAGESPIYFPTIAVSPDGRLLALDVGDAASRVLVLDLRERTVALVDDGVYYGAAAFVAGVTPE